MPKVEMGDDTGTAEESWEGLGDEDKNEEDVDKGKDKGEDGDEDLVSNTVS